MTGYFKDLKLAGGMLASVILVATMSGASASSEEKSAFETKPAALQNASYNGLTCDHVRAKVAESGVTAAYAYARYMGMSSRDIAKVRKACSV